MTRHHRSLPSALARLLAAIVASIVASMLALPAAADARTSPGLVEMRASVRVAADADVRLGDVARLEGAAEAHADLVLGRADAGAFELRADLIRQKLVAAGTSPDSIRVVGDRTVVRPQAGSRASSSPSSIRGAAASTAEAPARALPPSARRALAGRSDAMRIIDPEAVVASGASESGAIALIAGLLRNAFSDEGAALRLAVAEAQLAALPSAPGLRHEAVAKNALRADRIEFEIIAYDGARIVSRARLLVEPRLERVVARAGSDLRRGATASSSDAILETTLVAPSLASRLAGPEAIAGRVLSRSIAAGEPIESTDLVAEVAIRRNERVVVRREVGLVAIELEAVALEDGSEGDVIELRTAPRGRGRDARAISAEVVGPGRAVIRP